jgi:hypothetical protein
MVNLGNIRSNAHNCSVKNLLRWTPNIEPRCGRFWSATAAGNTFGLSKSLRQEARL